MAYDDQHQDSDDDQNLEGGDLAEQMSEDDAASITDETGDAA